MEKLKCAKYPTDYYPGGQNYINLISYKHKIVIP